jgi:hypothetical protein
MYPIILFYKAVFVVSLLHSRGCRLVYLPPYSPELNPIEEAFSAIKARIRRNRIEFLVAMEMGDEAELYTLLWDVVYSVTPGDIRGWYRHSGYML